MNPLVLARLGFKITTSLSEICKKEFGFTDLRSTLIFKGEENIFTQLQNLIGKYKNTMLEQQSYRIFLNKGYDYSSKNENPTIEKIVQDFDSKDFENISLPQLLNEIDVPAPRHELVKELSDIFIAIAKGAILHENISYLEKVYAGALLNKMYFTSLIMPISIKDLEREINIGITLSNIGLNCEMKINEYEAQIKKIDALKKEFISIVSPDRAKTISDRLETFSAEVKKAENTLFGQSLHTIGYLIATRGENPTLFEILLNNESHYKYRSLVSLNDQNQTAEENAKKVLKHVLEGYAYSYHIHFLENLLKDKSATATEPLNITLIRLKWTGQKNQLYSVLRELKAKGFIGNSYEDLSVFLKQNVDIFQKTSLSTITKEIGKVKKLPKGRRIDLK